MRLKTYLLTILICVVAGSAAPTMAHTDDTRQEIFEAEIIEVQETSVTPSIDGSDTLYQKLLVEITKGPAKDQRVVVETGQRATVYQPTYAVGDEVLISYTQNDDGERTYYVFDYVRRAPLGLLFGLFVGLSVLIGRWHGLRSLLGLGISLAIIGMVMLPQISSGTNPILVALLGAIIITPITFYLSHGINRKTTIAIVSTALSLCLTGLLGTYFIDAVHLTGFASDEALFLDIAKQGSLNIRGLLLAGFIIGALGVLDDITISQAAIVQELKHAKPSITRKELFTRAMNVGRDHIASLINTLVLVYTGSALPLLLLFSGNNASFLEIINYEIVAEEIVRTLVGSIGLIAAVPITSVIATRFATYLSSDTSPTHRH